MGQKCKDCKYLSDHKISIGRECVCPGKSWRTQYAMYKAPSGVACKLFEPKDMDAGILESQKIGYDRLLSIARSMHMWIFKNTVDEAEVYDSLGISDEENAVLGYRGRAFIDEEKGR